MNQKRRKYDISDTKSLAEYAHERIDDLGLKIDKLTNRVTWYSAGLAVLIFLLSQGMINLSPLIQSSRAETAHGTP